MAQMSEDPFSLLLAIAILGGLMSIQGRLRAREQLYWDTLQMVDERYGPDLPLTAYIHMGLSYLYYEWQDLEKSSYHCDLARTLGQKSGLAEIFWASVNQRILIFLGQGKPELIDPLLGQLRVLARQNASHKVVFYGARLLSSPRDGGGSPFGRF